MLMPFKILQPSLVTKNLFSLLTYCFGILLPTIGFALAHFMWMSYHISLISLFYHFNFSSSYSKSLWIILFDVFTSIFHIFSIHAFLLTTVPGKVLSFVIFFSEQALDYWRTGAESKTDLRFDLTNAYAIIGMPSKPNPLVGRSCDNESIIVQREETFIEVFDGKIESFVKHKDTGIEAYHLMVDGVTSEAVLTITDLKNDDSSLVITTSGNSGIIRLDAANTDVGMPTINTEIDSKKNMIIQDMHNYETGIKTIDIVLDGQAGTISMTTYDPDSGSVTGEFALP